MSPSTDDRTDKHLDSFSKWMVPVVLAGGVLGTFAGLDQRRRNLNFEEIVSNLELEKNYSIQIKTHVKEGGFELLEFKSQSGGVYTIQIFDRHNRSKVSLANKIAEVRLDFDPGETLTLNAEEIGRARLDSRVGTIQFTDAKKQEGKLTGVFFF